MKENKLLKRSSIRKFLLIFLTTNACFGNKVILKLAGFQPIFSFLF